MVDAEGDELGLGVHVIDAVQDEVRGARQQLSGILGGEHFVHSFDGTPWHDREDVLFGNGYFWKPYICKCGSGVAIERGQSDLKYKAQYIVRSI